MDESMIIFNGNPKYVENGKGDCQATTTKNGSKKYNLPKK